MTALLASFVCVLGIAGLFFLDRESVRTSKALWLPVVWLWIIGSRPISLWLGLGGGAADLTSQAVEGSPVDRFVFGVLLAAGLVVLFRRSKRSQQFLKASWPIILYFSYCLLSVLWSDFADVAFKRWIKAIGDLVMILVVVTDPKPLPALKRLFSRTGFILLPASVLFIRYMDTGRGYDPSGEQMNTGITTNKNSLGVITLVLTLGALWSVMFLLRSKSYPNRRRHLVAHGILLCFGLAVLAMSHSATAGACFAIGAVLMLASGLSSVRRRPRAIHAIVLVIVLAGTAAFLLGGQASIFHALGRKENLTGRTDIWAAVLPVVPNPVVGAGFESFWLGPRLQMVWSRLSRYMQVNEAHNGYIEVYLNLGWVGVGLIATTLISGYRSAVAAFRYDSAFGGLMLALVVAAALYSVTEAGFRMLNPIWFFFLLGVVGSRGVAAGIKTRQMSGRAISPNPIPLAESYAPASVRYLL